MLYVCTYFQLKTNTGVEKYEIEISEKNTDNSILCIQMEGLTFLPLFSSYRVLTSFFQYAYFKFIYLIFFFGGGTRVKMESFPFPDLQSFHN